MADDQITFHLNYAPNYQENWADGAFGGIAPSGDKIHIVFFAERAPIPDSITHVISSAGVLGNEVSRETTKGIVRTISTGLFLSAGTARQISAWLLERADELDSAQQRRADILAQIESNDGS